MAGRPHSEDARKAVHILFGAGALLLRYLSWWQAAAVAAAALVLNALVLPRFAPRIYRPTDRRFAHGIVFYPLAVLGLVLLFPRRLDIAAAAWGILAAGDGAASLIGQRAGRRRLPWNTEKSVEGSVAFFLCGAAAATALALWCRPAAAIEPALWFSIAAPIAAALVAALVESMPIGLDDNLSVPAAAGGVMWTLSLVDAAGAAALAGAAAANAAAALGVNAVVAWLGWKARTVNASGALAGAVIGAAVVVGAGWEGWVLLVATFAAATATSRVGLRRKTQLGIAEARQGRRGAGNAIANTGVAAVAALLAVATASRDQALLAFAAALTAGGSDTVASEIGKAFGRATFMVPSLRPAAPGTPGAVSAIGTAAGLAGAIALAALAWVLGIIDGRGFVPVVAGATAAAFAESALGATLEAPGIVNNDVLNFLNTLIAAAAAIALWRLLP
jgi:uncharacterized protein (TIGR00297 family)